jgi:hypothetical protein
MALQGRDAVVALVAMGVTALSENLDLLTPYLGVGKQHDPTRCPVALYLKGLTGGSFLAAGTTGVRVQGIVRIPFPPNLEQWVVDFERPRS